MRADRIERCIHDCRLGTGGKHGVSTHCYVCQNGQRPPWILEPHFALAGASRNNYVSLIEKACPSGVDAREFDADFRLHLLDTTRAHIITELVARAGHPAAANALVAKMAENFARDRYSPNRRSRAAKAHTFERAFVEPVTHSDADEAGEREELQPFVAGMFGSAAHDGRGVQWLPVRGSRGQTVRLVPFVRTDRGAASGRADGWLNAADSTPIARAGHRRPTSKAGETGSRTRYGRAPVRWPQSNTGREFFGFLRDGSLVRKWRERRSLPGLFPSNGDDAANYARYARFARDIGAKPLADWAWAAQRASLVTDMPDGVFATSADACEVANAFAACNRARRSGQPCTKCGNSERSRHAIAS